MSKRDNEHFVAWSKRIDALLRNQQRKFEQSRPKDNNYGKKKSSTSTPAPVVETTTESAPETT